MSVIVAPDPFRDEELAEPRKVFEDQGATVSLASTRPGTASGMLGARVKPDLLVAEAKAADYDAVVVVGGMGSPEHLWDHPSLHELLRQAAADGKVLGAICLSGAVLGKAGVAQGKHVTCWSSPEAIAALKDGGALYEKARVVVDGRVVTADGPTSSREFGEAVARVLQE